MNDIRVTKLPTMKTAISPRPRRSMNPMTSRDSPIVLAAERSRRWVPESTTSNTLSLKITVHKIYAFEPTFQNITLGTEVP
jgi:hypothetical protein